MIIKKELLSVEYKINETSSRKDITLNPLQKHKIHNIDLRISLFSVTINNSTMQFKYF